MELIYTRRCPLVARERIAKGESSKKEKNTEYPGQSATSRDFILVHPLYLWLTDRCWTQGAWACSQSRKTLGFRDLYNSSKRQTEREQQNRQRIF